MPKRSYQTAFPSKTTFSVRKRRRMTPSTRALRYQKYRYLPPRETGFVDLALAAYALNTTGSITLLATVAQGTTVNQRVGKKILWKSLQCRGNVTNDSTATTTDNAILIVYDKRPNGGSLPSITDILVSANSSSFNNDANSGRFQILKRMDFELEGNASDAASCTGKTMLSADFYLDLKNLPCEFELGTTGAIDDISRGALYLVTVGDKAAGTGDAIANLSFRTRFVDV